MGFALVALVAGDALAHRDVVPERRDDALARAQTWTRTADGAVSSVQWTAGGGTRVAALVALADNGRAPAIDARGVDGDLVGPWRRMEQTFAGDGRRVLVVDLAGAWRGAQLRVADADDARLGEIAWELVTPRYPDVGRLSRESDPIGEIYAVSPQLQTIGVIDRASWGARRTGCTATEDDWYRMAIHHTAGGQTSGGTVEGELRAVQAYTMDSGNFCDIPYQFMVGYDGSLWEGRNLALRSGATGGGNNDGNLAVCFLGCYHPNSCPGGNSHAATEDMMAAAQLVVQTLVRTEDIATSDQDIRGHRDWPGNATACPGDFVHARLGELRADLAWFSAEEVSRSVPSDIAVGEPAQVVLEVRNTGGLAWEPGVTFLGTASPRDSESELYDPSWPLPNRAATVEATVATGEVGRFAFLIAAPAAGEYTQSFGLVHEGVTWFADAPWGGGPGDDALVVTVTATGDGDDDDPADDPDDPSDPVDDEDRGDGTVTAGCSASGGAASGGLIALLALLCLPRRRGARA